MRLARLDAAVGDDLATDVDRDDQLRATLRLIEKQDRCRCGEQYDPLARACASCGRATFSPYVRPAKRAAPVLPEPDETLQIARAG